MNRLAIGYIIGAQVLAADASYTDKATVRTVQQKLHALSVATGNSAFDPYHDKYKDDGVIGSKTRSAVAAFNKAYGWPSDGESITDGTLTALQRPDVANPQSAQQSGWVSQMNKYSAPAVSAPTSTSVPENATVFSPRYSVLDPKPVEDSAPNRSPADLQRVLPRGGEGGSSFSWGTVLFTALAVASLGGVVYLITSRRGGKRASGGSHSMMAFDRTIPGLRRAR